MKLINTIRTQKEGVLWLGLALLMATLIFTLYSCGAIKE